MIFILVFIISLIAQFLLPWYVCAIVAFIIVLWLGKTGWNSFLQCFFATGLLWLFYAVYLHFQGGGILTSRISAMMNLPGMVLLLLTALIGGIVGGLGGLTGYLLKNSRRPKVTYR